MVFQVSASNACGTSARIRYSIRDQPIIRKLFHIDDQSGTICVEGALDYEKTTKYQLTVIAHDSSDGGHSGSALVNVHVEDVNDNSPVFYPADYNVSVREDAPVGSPLLVLSANDADEGAYGQIRYRIVSGGSEAFRLEPQSGYLYIQSRLTESSYAIVVQAKDGGGLVSEHNANVHVSVITPLTPTPQFTSNLYTFTAAEDILPGISIGQVEATGPFPITYTIYSGDPDHLFTIDRDTGKITVTRYLDADKWGSILLNIQAWMERGGANHTQVVIELADANDNEPRFEMEHVEAYVPEDQQPHIPFFAVQATDMDRGQNGEITYSLVHSEPPCPVTVRPLTGELALSAALDYETRSRYELVVRARDHGIPPRSTNITVTVNVLDVNDNAPLFDMHLYGVEVSEAIEPMTEIITMRAKDVDSEQNARISFQFAEDLPEFGIHSHSGSVFVKMPLDRELVADYRLVIIATDSGQPPLSTNATLQVIVLDVNDNSPNCSSIVPLNLNDDTPIGETFGTVSAIDPDFGANGTVTYRLQNEDPYFAIKPNGEVLLKQRMSQYGVTKDYRLSVIASDGGTEVRSAVCQVKISVEKVQSKVKFIEPIDRSIRLGEKCLADCRLIKLNASNVAHWEIETNEISRFFVISKGTLRTSADFDENYFKMSRLLSVSAFDSDGRKRQIIFTVLPLERRLSKSDNSTVFVRLSRTVPVGTKLTTVGQQSKDVYWRLSNETSIVQLDESTSALYSTANLALLNESSFTIGVTRTSLPDHVEEQFTVFVDIERENMHTPLFRNCPITTNVKENEQVGSMVARVEAIDADWGSEGQIAYRIVDSSSSTDPSTAAASSAFSVDSATGDVFLTRALDWRKTNGWLKEPRMYVVVEAEDRAREVDHRKRSTCVLFVNVLDVNDNAPHFLSATNISVGELDSSNGIVHYVVARDDDDGDNARINYTIVAGNKEDMFDLDPHTGALSLRRRLRSSTTIRVRAMDNGAASKYTDQDITLHMASSHRQWEYFTQSRYTLNVHKDAPVGSMLHDFHSRAFERAQLRILSNSVDDRPAFALTEDGKLVTSAQLTDLDYSIVVLAVNGLNQTDWTSVKVHRTSGNQNPPRIVPTSCGNLTVPENTPIPHLTRVFAVDNDESNDAIIHFNIVAGNEKNVFSINRSTGVVSCRQLDREHKPEYFLVITAEDHGVPARADTCTVRITVADENDNAPLFSEDTPEYIEINDTTPVGSVLARISAKDLDDGSNGKVIYSIVEDKSGLLDIRNEIGDIIFARDHPTMQKDFVITVRAEDEGTSRVLYNERSIRLALKRSKTEWDAPQPSFLSQRYTGVVKEGLPRGQLVLKISSSERLFSDAPLTYSIVSGNVDAAFQVDGDGRITTTQELDREIESEYLLKVVGNGNHRTVPETSVRIRVLNLNDNVPALPSLFPRKISEGAPIGTLIASITATDVDVGSRLEYSIDPSNPLFFINRFSGSIHLAAPLDYETAKEHKLQIQVSDGENVSKTKLIVSVIDENDNAPRFDKDFYDVTITKTAPVGSVVTKMTAIDPDSGLAGKLYYNFSSINQHFQIENGSGLVKVKSQPPSGSVHYVKVQAFDSGLPQRSSAVTLRISVTNTAENVEPRFNKKSFSFAVPEDTPPNVFIGNVRASNDINAKFEYRVMELSASRWARINHNGDVFLKKTLDRERNHTLKFTVEASSPHSFVNATTVVHLQVLDVNDNAPQFFVSSNVLAVNEHLKQGQVLARITAKDRDQGDNGRVHYRILCGNEHDMIRLDPSSGMILFNKWNEQSVLLGESFQKLYIAALDGGNPLKWNTAVFSVSFERDIWSGTAPFFPLPIYQAFVREDLPAGSVIVKSRAVSRTGVGETGWEYALKDNDEAFGCNPNTGDIVLEKQLDFETRNSYEFSLVVKDRSRRSAVVPISITVLGVDEYPPMFMRNTYTFQIPRSAERGQRVGAVTATDQDSGIDGVVRYELEGKALRYLGIDPDSGQIVLTRELNDKMKSNITFDEFVVIASSGMAQHSRVKVFVEIGDFAIPSEQYTGSLMNPQMLTIASLILLLMLLTALVVLIIRMRIRIHKQRKPKKQVYSVSRGNVAVMADLNRLSPKFEYEKQRVPLPLPPNVANKRPSSSSLSRCSDESIRLRQKISVDNPLSGRSASRSVPDSGIDPDDESITSSVTEYLTQIGVTNNKMLDQRRDIGERKNRTRADARYDSDLNELIYAKVDEILSPVSRMNTSFASNPSLSIPSFNTSPFRSNPEPCFQPLSKLLSELHQVNADSGRKIVNVDI